jgi:hypothetical protein
MANCTVEIPMQLESLKKGIGVTLDQEEDKILKSSKVFRKFFVVVEKSVWKNCWNTSCRFFSVCII